MKITHKEFLAEQAKLGIKVPKIYENLDSFSGAPVTPQANIFNVKFEGDFEGYEQDESKIAKNWKFFPVEPLTIKNVDGTVNDERSNIDIEFSNGEQINFSCFYSVGPTDPRNKDFAKLHIINGASHDVKDLYMQNLENYGSVILAILKTYESITKGVNEGFFGDLKNKVMGTIEYNASNNYGGSPEAQAFVTKDRRSKVQIETLTKKGMTPEEAKSAVMFVFDKSGKNPLGFMGKSTEYDPQTKTLKVTTSGGSNPSLMA